MGVKSKGPHGGRAKSIVRAADRASGHDCPYSDMMGWILENYHRIMHDVQPDVSNEKARRGWVTKADEQLTALFKKWGKRHD